MKNDQAIDFAKPYMEAKSQLADLHESMLLRDYNHAIHCCIHAIAEIRMVMAAIQHEKETQDALRQQAETV
jgi:hypothetical protein